MSRVIRLFRAFAEIPGSSEPTNTIRAPLIVIFTSKDATRFAAEAARWRRSRTSYKDTRMARDLNLRDR